MMETLVYPLWKLVQKQGRGYDFTIFENESTILLFWENEKTILLFGVGRENDFTTCFRDDIGVEF